MNKFLRCSLGLLTLAVALTAAATPIEIVELPDGEHPAELGGYLMTPFSEPTGTSDCTTSHSGELLCFQDYDGNPVELPAESPWWWQYDGTPGPDHGNIFVVRGESWIDLILPPNTRALSLFVGASGRGHAWIQAHDSAGNSTPEVYFDVNHDDTRGYGIYTSGCTALTRVTVEPWEWGFGYLASNEGECRTVPEPAPIGLLSLGLIGMLLARGYFRRRLATI